MPTPKTTSTLINLHDGANYTYTLLSAFGDIVSLLKDHCGPYATYAILPTRSVGNAIIDQYTKDGINIVSSLKTNTPLTGHVMRLVTYIGTRMDNACHDGTTTAMLLFCDLASGLLETLQKPIVLDPDGTLANPAQQRYFFKQELENFLTECEAVLDDEYLLVSDIARMFNTTTDKAIWAVAYHQAMIASKGDKELSRGIAEVLASMPVDLYGQYNLHTPSVETSERFIVKHHDFDFEIPGIVANVEHFNAALRTQLKLDDALLLVTPNELIRGNPETDYLIQMLTDDLGIPPLVKPLVILTPSLNDPTLFDMIHKHNAKYPHAKVIPLHMQVQNACKPFADALLATAGASPLQMVLTGETSEAFIDNVAIEQRGTRIYIKNLYSKTGDRLHPSYTDPERNVFYTKTLTELRTYIENATKQHNPDRGSEMMLMHVINLYRFMTSQNLVDLSIGGSSHEHVANISVAKDAFGAAVSALEHGVILGGHQRILSYACEMLEQYSTERVKMTMSDQVRKKILTVFVESFLNILYIIYYVQFSPPVGSIDELLSDCLEFTEGYAEFEGDARMFFLESVADDTLSDFDIIDRDLSKVKGFLTGENTISVVMQPIKGHQEFFKRARELLPKLINTTSLVDPFHVAE